MHCRKDRLVRSDCGAETGSTRTGYSASSSGAWWRPRVLQREPRWRPVEGECIQMTLTVSIKRSSDRSRAPKQESRSGETPRGALDGESADGRQAEEEEAALEIEVVTMPHQGVAPPPRGSRRRTSWSWPSRAASSTAGRRRLLASRSPVIELLHRAGLAHPMRGGGRAGKQRRELSDHATRSDEYESCGRPPPRHPAPRGTCSGR